VTTLAQHRADERGDEQTEERAGHSDQLVAGADADERDQRSDAQRSVRPVSARQPVG
jgi:hypothetical protein